jgi:hypothetical protein
MLPRRCLSTLVVCCLAACSASPWTVRIENARDVEVPLVRCAIVYPGGGSGGSSLVRAHYAVEFAAAREKGAPEIELVVFWLADAAPMRARITQLDARTDGITVLLTNARTIELKDRRGNDAAMLQTDVGAER